MKEAYINKIDNKEEMLNSLSLHFSGKDLEVSDGYHTFDELYDHRISLFIQLCRLLKKIDMVKSDKIVMLPYEVWRSKLHSDGTSFEGWFVLGINKEFGRQMTYHLPLARWEETSFAETLAIAPVFDGHASSDVLERLKTL